MRNDCREAKEPHFRYDRFADPAQHGAEDVSIHNRRPPPIDVRPGG
jgi:hypothetical protein